MGTLAGSTVMLLTVVWGGSVLAGRCDLDESSGLQKDRVVTRPWHDLLRTGVSTDAATPRCAWAMLATAGLYLVVQVWQGCVCVAEGGACCRPLPSPHARPAGSPQTSLKTPRAQVPSFFISHPKHAPYVSLVGCILCFLSLGAYCAYQVGGGSCMG